MNYIICTNLIKEKIGKNNIYLGTWALPDSKILLYKQKKINKFIWNNKKIVVFEKITKIFFFILAIKYISTKNFQNKIIVFI